MVHKKVKCCGSVLLAFGFLCLVISCGPKDPVSKAERMIKNEMYTEAIDVLTPIVKADESNAKAIKLLGDAYFERGLRGRNIYQIFDLSESDYQDFKQAVILYEKSQKLAYQEDVKRRRTRIMTVIGPRMDYSR